nr:ATPase domain-containing protein [uncultured Caldimonas sp.]
MSATPPNVLALERVPSRIPGLDVLLGGGFFRSGVYIVQGHPGSGKTILANQLCYSHVANGGRAVYVTLLAESHARMLQHIRGLSFFDESVIPNGLSYISAFHDLESEGLKGLMSVLRREMRARNVSVLILDGLVAAAEAAETDRALKKFIHEVQTSAVFHGCTVFLLTSGGLQRVNAEHTMVDGLIELEDRVFDARAERTIQVRKFRGAGALRGKHGFRITDDGLEVFPRIEALYGQPAEPSGNDGVLTTGVDTLDALLAERGLPRASASVVIGSTGTGKTTLALHYLSRSTADEPGLMFGFFESPTRLRMKAARLGLDLAQLEAAGALTFMWHPQGEYVLDELAHRLLAVVRERGIRRLAIDGLSGFFEATIYPERTGRFFSCLVNELRRLGVTVFMTLETRDVVSSVVSTPFGVSAFVDNLLYLRFVEHKGTVKRLLTITKMRDTDFDPGLHEAVITPAGMKIAGRYTADGDVIPSASPIPGAPHTPADPTGSHT